ncbi:MAG: hypothetical protein AB1806_00175 [Acidobacteriota bacterium]
MTPEMALMLAAARPVPLSGPEAAARVLAVREWDAVERLTARLFSREEGVPGSAGCQLR